MKHNLNITLALLLFFVLSQILGLSLINKDSQITVEKINNQNIINVTHADTSIGARPDISGFGSFLYIVIGITIGTLLVLILVKYNKNKIWKYWFLAAVWLATSVSLGVIIKTSFFFAYDVAIFISLLLALWKIFWPNVYIHNITEVLMYSGIALMLVPLFDVLWVVVLLLTISLYDMYAVWRSKHMIKMAKFQTESEVFAGIMIHYKRNKSDTTEESKEFKKSKEDLSKISASKMSSSKKISSNTSSQQRTSGKSNTAILGGGDVAFPLIFTGVIMENFIREGLTKSQAFMHSSIIILTTTIALALLFFFAKKDKFYPAMPFITAGCLIGWAIALII